MANFTVNGSAVANRKGQNLVRRLALEYITKIDNGIAKTINAVLGPQSGYLMPTHEKEIQTMKPKDLLESLETWDRKMENLNAEAVEMEYQRAQQEQQSYLMQQNRLNPYANSSIAMMPGVEAIYPIKI